MTKYQVFLIVVFLFFFGSGGGWVLELFFRRFFSGANPENPGKMAGVFTGNCAGFTADVSGIYKKSGHENLPSKGDQTPESRHQTVPVISPAFLNEILVITGPQIS